MAYTRGFWLPNYRWSYYYPHMHYGYPGSGCPSPVDTTPSSPSLHDLCDAISMQEANLNLKRARSDDNDAEEAPRRKRPRTAPLPPPQGISADDLQYIFAGKMAPNLLGDTYYVLDAVLAPGIGSLVECLHAVRSRSSKTYTWAIGKIVSVDALYRTLVVDIGIFDTADTGAKPLLLTYSMVAGAVRPIFMDATQGLHYCLHQLRQKTPRVRMLGGKGHERCREHVVRERAVHGIHVHFTCHPIANHALCTSSDTLEAIVVL